MCDERANLLRFGDLLDHEFAVVRHPLDGHLDVVFLAGLIEGGFRQRVAFGVKQIPFAVGVEAVATLDAFLHQRALLGVFGGDFGGGFWAVFGVIGEAHYVHDVAGELHFLVRPRDGGGGDQQAGGPIAIVREGDIITFDLEARTLNVDLTDEKIKQRLSEWKAPAPRYTMGVFAKYSALVSSASEGAVTRAE